MFGLTTISEAVPAPAILDRRARMIDFADELRRCGYDLAGCAKRLGVFPRLGVNFWRDLRAGWTPQEKDPVDTLLELFMDGQPVAVDRLGAHVSSAFVDAALEMRLAERTGRFLESKVCLFPCYGKYVLTDRAAKNTAINQVMWLWGESFILGGLVKRAPRRRAIDLCTGSGVHALLASDHCQSVVGADINPRAIEFARFNAALNGIGNVEFVLSDLFNSVESTCDLLLANPPYAPDTAAQAGDNFWSGGPDGTDILRRIVEAIPARLAADGAVHLHALYPNPAGTKTRDHFNHWLQGTLRHYDVLDHTWPVPRYEDLLSEQPFKGDKSAWRFGVVSLRLSRSGNGGWKEVAGKALFFDDTGSCSMVADHDGIALQTSTRAAHPRANQATSPPLVP
jgi:methylase of polypeptide subunit release factors